MDNEKEKFKNTVLFIKKSSQRCIMRKALNYTIKTQYLDKEQGKKNPTDRSVLAVRASVFYKSHHKDV